MIKKNVSSPSQATLLVLCTMQNIDSDINPQQKRNKYPWKLPESTVSWGLLKQLKRSVVFFYTFYKHYTKEMLHHPNSTLLRDANHKTVCTDDASVLV